MLQFLKQENKNLYRLTAILFLFSIVYSLFVFGREFYTGSQSESFLLWNLFLAWIPYYFSLLYTYHNFSGKVYKYAVGFIWLIFYPNAPYMLTDLIHLCRYNFLPTTKNLGMWTYFFLISMFVFLGLIISFVSLSVMHTYIKNKYKSLYGWIFILIVSLLSGFGIYLGRFIRLNSWNVITHPQYLTNVILNSINYHAIGFTLLFGCLTLFLYLLLYYLTKFYKIEN